VALRGGPDLGPSAATGLREPDAQAPQQRPGQTPVREKIHAAISDIRKRDRRTSAPRRPSPTDPPRQTRHRRSHPAFPAGANLPTGPALNPRATPQVRAITDKSPAGTLPAKPASGARRAA